MKIRGAGKPLARLISTNTTSSASGGDNEGGWGRASAPT
jgi:hypothetical protein